MNSTEARTEAAAARPTELRGPSDLPATRTITAWSAICSCSSALVYVVEGLGQVVGLISQPLTYYLKEVHGWTRAAGHRLYHRVQPAVGDQAGLRPDFRFPAAVRLSAQELSAHRQCGARSAAIFGPPRSTRRSLLLIALMLTAYAMAISSTLCGAVLVENGQRLHESGTFVNQQWLWFNVAADGGRDRRRQLVQHLPPARRCTSPPASSPSRRSLSLSAHYGSFPSKEPRSTCRA